MRHSAGRLEFSDFLHCFGYLFEEVVPSFLMHYLPAAKEHRKLHFVSFFQEFASVIEFYSQIVLVGLGPEPDFLERTGVMLAFFTAFAIFTLLLIKPFAIVHYAANRRVAIGRYLHKVQTSLTGLARCYILFYNSNLLVRFIDQPNRGSPNPVIYP